MNARILNCEIIEPGWTTRVYGGELTRRVRASACCQLDPKQYGTHSMRRTKASQIYKKTGNIVENQLTPSTRRKISPVAIRSGVE
ncbi:hypothetical protein [Mesorhizobium camelthorni]|uniref:hypothetical protein n=1 Tax=Allomesorhizobium camelthorni TaxID=475069 RepID=UPI001FE3ADD1|nr:hypothetical protein [Mesorhizobium camelthorni]